MSTLTTLVRNKGSPLTQKIIDQINNIGAGIWRIEGYDKDYPKQIKQFSGFLLETIIKNGKVIYKLINGREYEVVVENLENCFRWRELIEPNQDSQFIPVTKEGKLTLQRNRMKKLLKISSEELEKQLSDYIKKGKK